MSLVIAGFGYLGSRIGALWNPGDGNCTAICRHPSRPPASIQSPPIQYIALDLSSNFESACLPRPSVLVVCAAPSRTDDSYRKSYTGIAANLIRWAQASAPDCRVIVASSTGVYAADDGSWVDEETPLGDYSRTDSTEGERIGILRQTEELWFKSGLDVRMLRLAGIYGPGRNRLPRIRRGEAFERARKYTNRIHVDDAARLMLWASRNGKRGDIYLGVDHEPTLEKDFYEWIYKKSGIHIPGTSRRAEDEPVSGKRCSNARVSRMGFEFKYPTFREGYQSFWNEEVSS